MNGSRNMFGAVVGREGLDLRTIGFRARIRFFILVGICRRMHGSRNMPKANGAGLPKVAAFRNDFIGFRIPDTNQYRTRRTPKPTRRPFQEPALRVLNKDPQPPLNGDRKPGFSGVVGRERFELSTLYLVAEHL
jgi:hypothetical protein